MHSTVAFWLLLLHCSIRQSHFSNFSSLPRRPVTPFSRTIAFLQLSLTQRIRGSRFGNFCSIASFDSRILVAFPLPPRPCTPFSRRIAILQLSLTLRVRQSHFRNLCSIAAFDGRVLATFAQLQHSTVILTAFLLPRRPGTPFSRTIAFLQLSLTQRIRRSRFGNFC